MSLKFPRNVRLRKKVTFKTVYEEGRFLSNKYIAVHFYSMPGQPHRVGFTAGKRLGSAVKRNRCKRRLKECYRLYQYEVPSELDMIFVARRDMVDADWKRITLSYRDLLRRIKILLAKKG